MLPSPPQTWCRASALHSLKRVAVKDSGPPHQARLLRIFAFLIQVPSFLGFSTWIFCWGLLQHSLSGEEGVTLKKPLVPYGTPTAIFPVLALPPPQSPPSPQVHKSIGAFYSHSLDSEITSMSVLVKFILRIQGWLNIKKKNQSA